jgi:hypothetical protein
MFKAQRQVRLKRDAVGLIATQQPTPTPQSPINGHRFIAASSK